MIDDMKSARLEALCPSTARWRPLLAMRSVALSASIPSASLMKRSKASLAGGATGTVGEEYRAAIPPSGWARCCLGVARSCRAVATCSAGATRLSLSRYVPVSSAVPRITSKACGDNLLAALGIELNGTLRLRRLPWLYPLQTEVQSRQLCDFMPCEFAAVRRLGLQFEVYCLAAGRLLRPLCRRTIPPARGSRRSSPVRRADRRHRRRWQLFLANRATRLPGAVATCNDFVFVVANLAGRGSG